MDVVYNLVAYDDTVYFFGSDSSDGSLLTTVYQSTLTLCTSASMSSIDPYGYALITYE